MKTINRYGIECVQLERGFNVDDLEILTQISETAHLVEREYEKGDNSDRRRGFTHSPYHSVLGKYFQFDIKPLIRKALDTIEWRIKHKYDNDAFVYDSEWLKQTDLFTDDYIEERFQQAPYKLRIMHQIRRITLFMAKEDPFYTCILKEFCARFAEFVTAHKDLFELTESEQYSLTTYHVGTKEEIHVKNQAARIDPTQRPWMKRK